MANCKQTGNLNGRGCSFSTAGITSLHSANYYPPIILGPSEEAPTPKEGFIQYVEDEDGFVTKIVLPTGESFFNIAEVSGNGSFTDTLNVGANDNRYRIHTINDVIAQDDADLLKQAEALSLGRFIYIVGFSDGKYRVAGRTHGMKAQANGFDYSSGTAAEDASGWTLLHAGNQTEVAPFLKDASVITPVYTETVKP